MFHPVCAMPCRIPPQYPEVSLARPALSLGVSPIFGAGVLRGGAGLSARQEARTAVDRRFPCSRPWRSRSSSRGLEGRGAACWRAAAPAAGRLRRGGRWRNGSGARGTRPPARATGADSQATAARRGRSTQGPQAVLGNSVAVLSREALMAFSLLLESCHAARVQPSRRTPQGKGLAIRQSALGRRDTRLARACAAYEILVYSNEGHSQQNSSFTLKCRNAPRGRCGSPLTANSEKE